MIIGYLGPKGTFSQYATEIYIHADQLDACMVPYGNITQLIHAAEQGEIDEAVVPVENSVEGSVSVTLDVLAWEVELQIKREIDIPVEHHLLALSKDAPISKILSHPQAIGQCRGFLERDFSRVPIQYTYSTAQAAEQVAARGWDKEGQWAAVAAEKAAEEYKLTILHTAIQDSDCNTTRFIVLSKKDMDIKEVLAHQKAVNVIKTSIVFSTENEPGSLYQVLQILNLWDINMTKIESRPAKKQLGRYIFFVDVEGHREEEHLKDAFTMIKRKTSLFKMLGSYSALSPLTKV